MPYNKNPTYLQKTKRKLADGTIKEYVYDRKKKNWKKFNTPDRYKRKYYCKFCKENYTLSNKSTHVRTMKHIKNTLKNNLYELLEDSEDEYDKLSAHDFIRQTHNPKTLKK